MKLTKYEQETVILFNEEESTAQVYTHNSRLKHRLADLLELHPETISLKESGESSCTYIVPKQWIKFNPPRILSEEQRAEITRRFSA